MTSTKCDIFAEAREKYTIPDLWQMLRLPGEPRATCKSPFRDERTPSFSIFDNGKAWKDHATGEGGDVVEFIKHALGCDYSEVRAWLRERIGIDFHDYHPEPRKKVDTPPKSIKWTSELVTGTAETWKAFSKLRGYSYPGVHVMVQSGILRFTKVADYKCFVVTDETRRAAEIRRLDCGTFGTSKAYPLQGVDKSWLPGLALLKDAPKSHKLILVEGATDLLAALDLYTRYRKHHAGKNGWSPAAVLGASCRNLHPEAVSIIRGRYVRIIPDADAAGDQMADTWQELLRKHGCTVDVVDLPRGSDLSDNLNSIIPTELFQ
jgi:DNA primase